MGEIRFFARIKTQEKEIEILDSIKLNKIVGTSYDSTDEEISTALKQCSQLIIDLKHPVKSIELNHVINNKGEEYNSLEDAAKAIKNKGITNASEKFVMSVIRKNLNKKTKSAYGIVWEYKIISLDDIDFSDYKVVF